MESTLLLDYEYAPDRAEYLVRALLTLRGDAPSAAERVPLTVSLVLDRSGSMAGEPLAAARGAAAALVRRLHPEDAVSVVAYDDTVRTVAPPSTGAEHRAVVAAIGGIEAGGSTNLSGGWLRGRELVVDGGGEGTPRRVILLTDGLANAGITDPATLIGLCREAKARGVTTTTIGFGPGYDERLLRAMADAGGGSTYYIERADQAGDVFAAEIDGLLSLVAQNVSVAVRPGASVTRMTVRHDYPTLTTADEVRVELGDLYAREPRVLLLEFVVAGAPLDPIAGERRIAEVVVDAHVLTAAGGVERQTITLRVASLLDEGVHVQPEVRRELVLLEAVQAREAALQARERGDYDGGATALHEAAVRLAEAIPDYGDAELQAEVADLGAMAARFAAQEVTGADAKYLGQMAYAAGRKKSSMRAALARPAGDPE